MRIVRWLGLALLCGCGSTSYGVTSDGVFPPRPAGADYPNWEHECTVVTRGNATEVLNDSGKSGWELVALTNQGGKDMMCFKRAKAAVR